MQEFATNCKPLRKFWTVAARLVQKIQSQISYDPISRRARRVTRLRGRRRIDEVQGVSWYEGSTIYGLVMSARSGSFVPTEPRNTYLFRRAKFCSPVHDRRYSPFKEIYFFPAVQFVQKESPCEWKRTFSPFFFSYQLNELFFIRPTTVQRWPRSSTSFLFLHSDTGVYSSASVRFLSFFMVSVYIPPATPIFFSLFFDSLLLLLRYVSSAGQ